MDTATLTAQNAQRWRVAKVTRQTEFAPVAKRLCAPDAKAQYQTVTRMTGVPWWIIAVIHEREASQDWSRGIAQGDPWDAVSRHTPTGRGPFQSWQAAAVDALCNCSPFAAKWKDWSSGGALTLLERYNGLGYAMGPIDKQDHKYPPQPSPYIWSGTDQYKSGKYVADHDYRPDVIDAQLGCAGLLIAMRAIDPTIRFSDESPAPPDVEPAPPIVPAPEPVPPPTPAPQENWLSSLISFLLSIFRPKKGN